MTMVLILIFAEVLGLYGCVLPAAAQRLNKMSLKVGQAHRCIDYEHESTRCSLFMTFTTTSVCSYKTSSVYRIVAFTSGSTDVVQRMVAVYTVVRIYDTRTNGGSTAAGRVITKTSMPGTLTAVSITR